MDPRKKPYSIFSVHAKHDRYAHGEDNCANVTSNQQKKSQQHTTKVNDHQPSLREKNSRVLRFCFMLTFLFSLLEGIFGYTIHSIALQSDGLHMLSDSVGLMISYFANDISKRPATIYLSFGYGKAEVIGALINCMFTVILTMGLLIEAVIHLAHPVSIHGPNLLIVASIGLLVNAIIAYTLSKSGLQSLNTKSAFLHAIGDLLASFCAIIAGAIIYWTGWSIVDPILSLVVIAFLSFSNYRIIKKSILILMAAVPEHLQYDQIGKDILGVAGVKAVHDLHIWYLSAEQTALAAHIVSCQPNEWPQVLQRCQTILLEKYGIDHITLQYEYEKG